MGAGDECNLPFFLTGMIDSVRHFCFKSTPVQSSVPTQQLHFVWRSKVIGGSGGNVQFAGGKFYCKTSPSAVRRAADRMG